MDIECFVQVIAKHVTKEQVEAILQEFSDADDNGHCAVCGRDDVPVDEQGKEIEGDDMENVWEYQERHVEGCPILFFEQYR